MSASMFGGFVSPTRGASVCALKKDDSVWCSTAITVGADRGCAVGVDGLPRCWGAPLVGDGSALERRAPTPVAW